MENQRNFSNAPMGRALPNATATLVLGIISIVGCFCYGIVGVICGIIALVLSGKDLKLYRANPGMFTEGSLKNLKAGRVCAIIGLVLSTLYMLAIIMLIATVGTAVLSDPNLMRELQNMR